MCYLDGQNADVKVLSCNFVRCYISVYFVLSQLFHNFAIITVVVFERSTVSSSRFFFRVTGTRAKYKENTLFERLHAPDYVIFVKCLRIRLPELYK